MTLPLKPLRRRFMVRTGAVVAGLLLGCAVTLRLLPLGPPGVVLGIFLAATLLILAIRCLNETWSKGTLEIFQEIRNAVGFAQSKPQPGDVEAESEEFHRRLMLALADTRRDREERRRLIAEAFHALGQPLTALRCSLELGLRNGGSAEQYRQRLEEALEQAERMARLSHQFHRLAEAIDFDAAGKSCRFDRSLNLVLEEIAALAEVKQIRLSSASARPVMVVGDEDRLAEALFYILQFSVDGAPPQSELTVRNEIACGQMVFTVESKMADGNSWRPPEETARGMSTAVSSSTLGVRIAEHIVRRLGGKLERELSGHAQIMRVRLPVVSRSSDPKCKEKLTVP